MSKRGKGIGVLAIALVLILALVGASCAPSAAPTEEMKVVRIGNMCGMTGPLATTVLWCHLAEIDYAKWVNEHGGIDGVMIDEKWEDTKGLVPKCITAFRRFKDAGAVAIIEISSAPLETMAETYQREQVPVIALNAYTPLMITKPKPWIFSALSGWGINAATVMRWAKQGWKEPRPPRVGIIIYDHASGWDSVEGIKKGAELGFGEFVGNEVVPFLGAIDTTTEWLRMAGKKPDLVYIVAYGASLMTLIKDAYRLEVQKKGIKLAASPLTVEKNYIKAVGADEAEGWCVPDPTPEAHEAEWPGMRDVYAAAKKYRGWEPDEITGQYIGGWITAAVAVEGIRLAIEKVGLENIDGLALRDAYANIKGFDCGLYPPITMSDDLPVFLPNIRVYQVQQGVIKPISGWIEMAYRLDW